MNNQPIEQRIQKGIEYFWNLKPSQWSLIEQHRLVEFLKILKVYMSGEKIHATQLSDEPRDIVDVAKEVFEI